MDETDPLIKILEQRIQSLREEIDGYEAALRVARQRQVKPVNRPVVGRGERTQDVLDIIRRHRNQGITHAEIRRYTKEATGEPLSNNYPYAQTAALQKAGEIHEENGKWFPVK